MRGGGLLTLPAENVVERLTAAGWLHEDEPATDEDLNGGKEASAECTEQLATGEDETAVCASTGWRAEDEPLIGEDLKP